MLGVFFCEFVRGETLRFVLCSALSAATLTATAAWADGPHIAFNGTQGDTTVTLFSAPDPLVAGPLDLNVLVQRASDGGMVAAQVAGQLVKAGQRIPFTFAAAQGSQLPEADVRVSQAGLYQLELDVKTPGGVLRFNGTLPVDENHSQRNTVLWAVFLPLVGVLLFLANQQAKRELRRTRSSV
jgi:hypothetical protein